MSQLNFILLTSILLAVFIAQVFFLQETTIFAVKKIATESSVSHNAADFTRRTKNNNRSELIPLDILTDEQNQDKIVCPPNTRAVFNNPMPADTGLNNMNRNTSHYKIPMVIHQGCKSRCVSEKMYELTEKWKAFGIPYYFHDDAAVDRLVYSQDMMLPEFPQLQMVWEHCIVKPVVKSDIWRMLLLYKYGGIYADLDTTPVSFSPLDNILPDDQMYSLAQPDYLPTFHFMASMPGHSIPFLTVHEQLKFLLFTGDTGIYNPAKRTGPGAIRNALSFFNKEDPSNRKQLEESGKEDNGNFTFRGINGQTMRREGLFTKSKAIVNGNAFSGGEKVAEYKVGNVIHYGASYGFKARTGQSCFELITRHYNN